jgi:hypothetical protein
MFLIDTYIAQSHHYHCCWFIPLVFKERGGYKTADAFADKICEITVTAHAIEQPGTVNGSQVSLCPTGSALQEHTNQITLSPFREQKNGTANATRCSNRS